MKFYDFMKEKLFSFLIFAVFIFTIEVFLIVFDDRIFIKLYIGIGTFLIYFLICFFEFIKKKSFYQEIQRNMQGLEQKYLIAEMIKESNFIEAEIVKQILLETNKSMIENVNQYKYQNQEYKEYIELWIHEIKTPISVSKMMIENNRNKITESIEEEIDKIDNFTEQALFYARSNHVEKDYMIKENDLKEIIHMVVLKNKKELIHRNIKIELKNINTKVFTDQKWTIFIVNQILTNSIKYSKKENAEIEIFAKKEKEKVILEVSDNGRGMKSEEIERAFEKGFTGDNGRKDQKATGLGLYLCKKLCDKLKHEITISSMLGKGTKVQIIFPKNSYYLKKER